MSITMPQPDAETIAKRDYIVAALREIVTGEGVIDDRRAAPMGVGRADGLSPAAQWSSCRNHWIRSAPCCAGAHARM